MPAYQPPSSKLISFNCPHCDALAHQTWFETFAKELSEGNLPFVPNENTVDLFKNDRTIDDDTKRDWLAYVERLRNKEIFIHGGATQNFSRDLANIWISQCYSCKNFSLWLYDKVIHPFAMVGDAPNEDLPEDVRRDYDEARAVIDISPRSSAALLRLCIQKLCKHIGGRGNNINDDIAKFVTEGLDVRVQQALDIVRVVGNNAVHPGQIDLRDDKEAASRLFGLVNLIAEKMISQPKHIEALFNSLPPNALAQIAKRDQH